jgi:transcriptional regulator with XRE-family HTH domain
LKTLECESCNGTGKQPDGAYIRGQREKRGVSLRDAAEEMQISATYLSNIESGRRRATWELIKKFDNAMKRMANDSKRVQKI